MACRYPDADSPGRAVGERRRRTPRLPPAARRADARWTTTATRTRPRRTASTPATPRSSRATSSTGSRYQVAGSTFRSTDLTHWLALDVAARALADAGFPDGEGLPRERTGVVVGNSLTGEFSRANLMRLRWPYVRRMVAAALQRAGLGRRPARAVPRRASRPTYKSPFPPIDEDTLAGGLANTIAGRICNHFDLKGGGYTVDGACSSSLLSVATACNALVDGDLDVAVAGGVDLSIDPFEIIGFAKTGALATGEMRVYDRGSNGFWPGEGCGMVVLMREDGRPRGRPPHLRHDRRLGRLLRRQGRHHPARGRAATGWRCAGPTSAPGSASRPSATSRATAPAPPSATPPSCTRSPRRAGAGRPGRTARPRSARSRATSATPRPPPASPG